MKLKKYLLLSSILTLVAFNTAAYETRLEGQFGIATGDPELSEAGISDDLDTDEGLSYGVGLYVDKAWSLYPEFTFGIQYNRITDADYSGSPGDTFANLVLLVPLEIEYETDLFTVNFLWRDNDGSSFNNSSFHPYIGAGVGYAFTDVDLSANIAGISVSGSDDDSDFAFQFMGGFDYDITANAYIGVNASYLRYDANFSGTEAEFETFRAMGIIGYRF